MFRRYKCNDEKQIRYGDRNLGDFSCKFGILDVEHIDEKVLLILKQNKYLKQALNSLAKVLFKINNLSSLPTYNAHLLSPTHHPTSITVQACMIKHTHLKNQI